MVYFRKTLLYIGIGNLLLLILLLSYFLYLNISEEGNKKYIQADFESLDYAEGMRKSIFNINKICENYFFNPNQNFDRTLYNNNIKSFNVYLDGEENTLFEKGENALAGNLKNIYKLYINGFDSALIYDDHRPKLYFSKFVPRQKLLVSYINQIFVTNYYALIARNKELNSTVNNGIILIIIFFELILFFVLYLFARSVYKTEYQSKKSNGKRDQADYPKFFSSSSSKK